MKRTTMILTALAGAMAVQAVSAQDVVVMRRTIAPPHLETAPSRATGSWRLGDSVVTPGCSASQPSLSPVTCVSPAGATLRDSACSGVGRPSGAGTAADWSRCTYRWVQGEYSAYSPTCSTEASRIRTVSCVRSDAASTSVDASFCDPSSPDARTKDGPVAYYGGCTYTAGEFVRGTPSSTCSAKATRRDATSSCTRSGGNVPSQATPQECDAAGVATSVTVGPYEETSGCSYSPFYSDQYSACSNDTQSAPIITCTRSDGVVVANSLCAKQSISKACTSKTYSCSTKVAGKEIYSIESSQFDSSVRTDLYVKGTTADKAAAGAAACEATKSPNGTSSLRYCKILLTNYPNDPTHIISVASWFKVLPDTLTRLTAASESDVLLYTCSKL